MHSPAPLAVAPLAVIAVALSGPMNIGPKSRTLLPDNVILSPPND
ncbi:MAG: hypothetical protein WCP30_05525 [Mycobacteriaceae bacterium]